MQAFDKTDRNGDGFLTFKEIQKLLKSMNMDIGKKYAYNKYQVRYITYVQSSHIQG